MDIARQMIETSPGNMTDLMFGGGHLAFNSSGTSKNKWDCNRKDGRDLIKQWKQNQRSLKKSHEFVNDLNSLKSAVRHKPDKTLGIFSLGHMSYEYKKPAEQPSLPEMTQAAIEILSDLQKRDDNKGFFLMVESGRIGLSEIILVLSKTFHQYVSFQIMHIMTPMQTLLWMKP